MNADLARLGDMPVSGDAARERVVELVQQAYADGRLDPAELDRRLGLALTATSAQDLAPIVADLPGTDHDDVVELRSTGGHVRRRGDWQVPRRLLVDSEYGSVRLDLSRAYFPHHRVGIELRLTYGGATIILPAGAGANADGVRTAWGSVKCRAQGHPRGGAPHVEFTGELTYGRLTIRNARR